MCHSSATESRLREIDRWLAEGGVRRESRKRLPPSLAVGRKRAPGRDPSPDPKARGRGNRVEVLRAPGWDQIGSDQTGVRAGNGSKRRSGNRESGWLVHGFSTRTGGGTTLYLREEQWEEQSAGRDCGDLNLGFTSGDDPRTVAANRTIFVEAVWGGGKLPPLVTLRQIHSSLTLRAKADDAPASHVGLSRPASLKGDGLMTDQPGILLGIQTADCLPILVADTKKRAVAAFHAGWRGTLQRIVEKGIGRMRLEFGSDPQDLIAAIGPGVGACCYAVGDEVRQEFESQFDYAASLFREVYDSDPVKEKYPLLFLTARAPGHSELGPKLHLDLAEANRRQLLAAGLKPGAVFSVGGCTSCHIERFFSHRREQGFTGRLMSVIGIR